MQSPHDPCPLAPGAGTEHPLPAAPPATGRAGGSRAQDRLLVAAVVLFLAAFVLASMVLGAPHGAG
ncbi:MAG TPA: hypothetical protein VK081_07540 [Planctomycetota bacterium]|nr:hypothetical protein [Planctomycetota bacterium]